MSALYFFIPPLMIASVLALTLSLARFSIDGKWHRRYGHSCGYHAQYETKFWDGFCPSCGEKMRRDEILTAVARAKWPMGWEYLERQDGFAK